jgi:diguanylate cyclase (GGDEF)-like protein
VAVSRLSGRRLTPIAPWPAASTLEAHVRGEQVRVLFQQALPAQLIAIVAAAIIGTVLWGVGDHTRIAIWFIVVTMLTLGRIAFSMRFRRRVPVDAEMAPWEQGFVLSLTAVCLAWGLGGWLIMPRHSVVHQAVMYFFLMGVAGGAIATYSAHAVACMAAILALMVPATVGFAFEPETPLRAMAAGGILYLAAALRSTRSFGFFLRRTFQLSFELQQAHMFAQALARTDDLTGIANRRAFVEQGTRAVEQARRYGRPLTMVMFDIDHFKKINDTHGHAAGDAALVAAAAALRDAARTSDTPGRLGGEEFGLLLPETGADAAMLFAERLRGDVAAITVPHDGAQIRFTCSLGVAEWRETMGTLDVLMQAADDALYRAKATGRNRVSRHR